MDSFPENIASIQRAKFSITFTLLLSCIPVLVSSSLVRYTHACIYTTRASTVSAAYSVKKNISDVLHHSCP